MIQKYFCSTEPHPSSVQGLQMEIEIKAQNSLLVKYLRNIVTRISLDRIALDFPIKIGYLCHCKRATNNKTTKPRPVASAWYPITLVYVKGISIYPTTASVYGIPLPQPLYMVSLCCINISPSPTTDLANSAASRLSSNARERSGPKSE